jgi:hypothetical protein
LPSILQRFEPTLAMIAPPSGRIILSMTANELLQVTLPVMRDADLPTDEKLAVLHAVPTVIRDSAEAEKEALAAGARSGRQR